MAKNDGIVAKMKGIWNAFFTRSPTSEYSMMYSGDSSYFRHDKVRLTRGNERSIVNAMFNRIAVDVSLIDFKHVLLDDEDRYICDMNSELNYCLTVESNADQDSRSFIRDLVLSMLDEGVVAVVPEYTKGDPCVTSSFKILSFRTAKILQWYPDRVRLQMYDENTGRKKEVVLPKKVVAIIENPFYSVMNEPNSTLMRLMRKLSLLDITDEKTASGKLDLIIQLPYLVKSPLRKAQAEDRRAELEQQLESSKYGVAYIDGTEKIVQLNRSLENNLLSQVDSLTKTLFSQLGMSEEVLNNTADEKTLQNYYTRLIEPICSAIVNEMNRKFLSKTARTQGQSIFFYRNPFKLIPITNMAELADKFTRNEILSSNEIRQLIGLKPSADPKADELTNSNMPQESSDEEKDLPSDSGYDDSSSYAYDPDEYSDETPTYSKSEQSLRDLFDVLGKG